MVVPVCEDDIVDLVDKRFALRLRILDGVVADIGRSKIESLKVSGDIVGRIVVTGIVHISPFGDDTCLVSFLVLRELDLDFLRRGMLDIADRKTHELEEALWEASEQGRYPVLCDQSPCLHRMRETIKRMKLYEPAEFIYTFLRPHLVFKPTDRPVAVHITCSMRKMGLDGTLVSLAKLCSNHVFVPEEVGCCGFAGDRGFTHPELNAYALRKLRPQLEANNIQIGYSNSRTCEIGLATNTGIPYVSIAYLVDECTTPATDKNNNHG